MEAEDISWGGRGLHLGPRLGRRAGEGVGYLRVLN